MFVLPSLDEARFTAIAEQFGGQVALRQFMPSGLGSVAVLLFATACILPISVNAEGTQGKTASVFVDAAMRENARRNVAHYDWAQAYLEELQERVRPYMELDEAELWQLLPGQETGRSKRTYSFHSAVSPHDMGCPQCYLNHGGESIGRDQSRVTLLGRNVRTPASGRPITEPHELDSDRPWQVQCLRCETWFPKNDFAAYYESALDETGRFRIGQGDSRYLKPMDGVEGEARQWIEDGTGVVYDGHKWFYAGRYAHTLWREMPFMAKDMAILYTLTGDIEYARRAAIIIDRIADFYPEMDEAPSRELGMFTSYRQPGRVEGRGWEYANLRRPVAKTYDYIFDAIREDPWIVEFLDRMSREHGGPDKRSFAAINDHWRKNLLIEFIGDIIAEGEAEARGRPQTALAVAAVALADPERTPQYLDWLFEEKGGRLPHVLIEHMQRDGYNINSGLGYMSITPRDMYRLAEILSLYEHGDYNLYAKYPNLLNGFTKHSRMRVLDKTFPAVGDGGSSMSMGRLRYPMEMLLDGYRRFPSAAIAREIVLNNPGNWEQEILRMDIYAEDPEARVANIRAQAADDSALASFNSGGTGFAVLQAPAREYPRAAAIWYGRSGWPSHAHFDRLTLHLWAYGSVMMPDMGYPEYTGSWPKYQGFTRHTISHNTLMINDTRQGSSYAGKTRLFAGAGPLRVADIDGLGSVQPLRNWEQVVYNDVKTYRRALVMVDVNEADSYLVDIFWARGGDNHRLIQNAGSSVATVNGLNMASQKGGSVWCVMMRRAM